MRISFGCCVLDLAARELTFRGEPVHLPAKQFQLLELLVENRPRAMSKAELHAHLWPETFVSEAALSSLVADLRSAIGDTVRDAALIRTVHRYGYAFSGQVSVLTEEPAGRMAYRLVWGHREIALRDGDNLLGRAREAVAWIDDPSVSRHHARIRVDAGHALVEDLGSKNGTFRNQRRLEAVEPLEDGDSIRLGSATVVFRVFSADAETHTGHGLELR